MAMPANPKERLRVWLAVATVLSLGVGLVPSSGLTHWTWQALGGEQSLSLDLFAYLTLLAIGLLLALSAPRRSGLIVGELRPHWWKVIIVCAIPVILMLLDDTPKQGDSPFAQQSYTMWLLSPMAQDLIFIGFLYGQLEQAKPGTLHPKLPISWALAFTAFFFAIFHLPNLAAGMSPGFMLFQLAYTGVGLLVVGLSRQWTGSILYAVLAHTLVNFLAWYTVT